MPKRQNEHSGGELFIVDNSEDDWKVRRYLHDWCGIAESIDIATGFFDIGALLSLDGEWQKIDKIRILMGDEVSARTKRAFASVFENIKKQLDESVEREKLANHFLTGVDSIVDALKQGKIECRVYRKDKFHAKAYITHAKLDVVGSFALVGSSNFTVPGITQNVELNVQIAGTPVSVLQEWYEEHWLEAEDVTPDILKVIERHTRAFTPFEIYCRSLQQYFLSHEETANEWESERSKIYPVLAQYQRDGYAGLLKRSDRWGGAFLCDGVGLGKTFIGLMLIERFVEFERKNVALFVPKSAKEPVWERELSKRLPEVFKGYSRLKIFSHTDLNREKMADELEQVREQADVVIIDEAHHFRNTGTRGETDGKRRSRYWQLFDLIGEKQVFFLTATPINNSLLDFQHMVELFSRHQGDYFAAAPLGIHSLRGHIRQLERKVEEDILGLSTDGADPGLSMADATDQLKADPLFDALVVQRSRNYVKESMAESEGQTIVFPKPRKPKVADYSVKQTYGKLLDMVSDAFHRQNPLFVLGIYNPLAYYKGEEEAFATDMERGRLKQVVALIRTNFLKRFESSAESFRASCWRLLFKLLAWMEVHAETEHEKAQLDRWKRKHTDLLGWSDQPDLLQEDDEGDLVPEELLLAVDKLDRADFRVEEIFADTLQDLEQVADFLIELEKFKVSQDSKLRRLIRLLRNDPTLSKHKVLIFTEFSDTARYLFRQLTEAGIEGVAQIDSMTTGDRSKIIQRFAPYYNESSSEELGDTEIRVLIATDVLSEGLNLQDATRLINYDLHWNPVRLMQRIGRVDRRMNPEVETKLLADHPDQKRLRGTVGYWNFLPPEDLEGLLRLYKRVSHKTLRISKTLGIEGRQLLTEDDDFEDLKNFAEHYEGVPSPDEKMHLEWQKLLKAHPDLPSQLSSIPNGAFSGKKHSKPGTKAIFFCYARPAYDQEESERVNDDVWTEDAGDVQWYLYDLSSGKILEDPFSIIKLIRSAPDTERNIAIEESELSAIRTKVEKHITQTLLEEGSSPCRCARAPKGLDGIKLGELSMSEITAKDLASVQNFPRLVEILRDKLDWPIGEDYGFDDIVYDYDAKEIGLKEEEAAKIREIHQLRPLTTNQPWGVFFVSFEDKAISVTVMRRILRGLVLKKRGGASTSDRQAWAKSDLIFATNFGKSGERELAFVHFSDGAGTGDLPVMKVLGWNASDTKLHNEYVGNTLASKLRWPDDPINTTAWRAQWASAFELRLNEAIRTSKDLAIRLAGLATQIRARANQLLEVERDDGPMQTMLSAFRKALIHDLDEDGFSDMFAQTICYGLLAASMSRFSTDPDVAKSTTNQPALSTQNISEFVPRTNPFLRELFESFLTFGGRDSRSNLDFDELGVRDVVDMLNAANMLAVLRDFGDRNPKEDPVIHFYELFLKEYDPQKRMQRGVFYTPRPIVSFIVHEVDKALEENLGLELGLADTTTWGELAKKRTNFKVPDHINPDQPFVQILDPATGTGTFLVEVIARIHARMISHWSGQGKNGQEIEDAWNKYVPKYLLPRLTAFELLMAPYAIAHMKVGLKLAETGYRFGSDERARIFLTNALESPRDLDMEFYFMSEALAHESVAANDAKAKTSFTAIIGNPPYSLLSANLSPEARSIVEPYRFIDGVKIKERGALQFEKIIQDDYVKFLRMAEERTLASGQGVMGIICNHSVLFTSSLRGVRRSFLDSYDTIKALDLHGSTARQAQQSEKDENVFEIKQGVCVLVASRYSENREPGSVSRADCVGLRDAKYNYLLSQPIKFTSVKTCAPNYEFEVRQAGIADEYSQFELDMRSVFNVGSMGVVTARDNIAIAFEDSAVLDHAEFFRSSELNNDELCRALNISNKKGWDVSKARQSLRAAGDLRSFTKDILYRPFDLRRTVYHQSIIWGMSFPTMQHMIDGDNTAICTARHVETGEFSHVFPSSTISGHHCVSLKEVNYAFPLWLKPELGEPYRRSNLDKELVERFGSAVGLCFEDGSNRTSPSSVLDGEEQAESGNVQWNGICDLSATFGPRDLFDWIYAVLHSPGYRRRYAEFLKSDFPRIPTPGSPALFKLLVPLGRQLIALHLLKMTEASVLLDPEKFSPAITFNGAGEARVERGFPNFQNGKVMINENRWFEDVPEETWEFRVGGYQVCQKWLKDRAAKGGKNPSPGRVLTDDDILHYRRIIVSLTETRRLMEEIDQAIEQHGGWPDAFAQEA